MALDAASLRKMYVAMLTVRRFEETADDLFLQGRIYGTVHTSIGQEAVSVGVCANLRRDDIIVSTHRGHGHAIAKGTSVRAMMAELFGKKTGVCRGRGGSMHVADKNVGLMGANPIVGANIPIAAGIGLAIQLAKGDQVCVSFFGDGASNQGTFHEGLNLASLWRLPVVFVCENNHYAVTVPVAKSTSVRDIAERARAYDIPGVVVDGMDLVAVYETAREAVARARSGEGPSLIECKTYRFRGHSRGDPPYGAYRTKEELDGWLKRDPIVHVRRMLKLGEDEVKELEAEVEATLEDAVRFAQESPTPEPEEAMEDIFI
ncbi:MAG: thiamine pyrophosphate-dependent dehydrogenase E1 component subunit alpha [Nitrospinota bacterium]